MFAETKVYYDGSHYIAIPHTTNPRKRRKREKEEVITVVEEQKAEADDVFPEASDSKNEADVQADIGKIPVPQEESAQQDTESVTIYVKKKKVERKTTRAEIFNRLYKESMDMPKVKRRKFLINGMRKYFDSDKKTADYVEDKLEKKIRNLICRRVRFTRKAYMHDFNYFVTLTYNDVLHTEQTFRKKLMTCLKNYYNRYDWKYMGIWERSPKGRLHFHALFHIPEGTMPGELINVRDYSLVTKRMQNTVQNTFFNKRFGRSDFEAMDKEEMRVGNAMSYILKYIEKTGEKIVYSRGLPMYLISDIQEDDVATRIGLEDKKLLLFDNFKCWDEGELIGEISNETKKRMRGSN